MKYSIALLFSLLFISCLKELDTSEIVRNNIFDPYAESIEVWFKQTGNVTSTPDPIITSNVKHTFKYEVINQRVIDNRENFEVLFYRYSGNQASLNSLRPKIFKQNNRYYFEVSAYNFTNPDGNFCFSFALSQIGRDVSTPELKDCWKL